ncbi:unnamed protein product [Chrysodeixis includens]|uniref:Uncharacterized protein n=1 Tax=Chrysodeixis includens TaxID=689277 RepID=A0A9P0FTY6_CHRIL|nr:unnamed protein product [Chrysodeixis includens]
MDPVTRDVSDLDKFKRRLIRTVARLLLQEKRPEKEVWECLKKETSYECKALWSRMRALTIRKLEKLFECNDQVARIPKAARMSLTDWLLFDMVLVHQNVDVIHMQRDKQKEDPKPLVDLVAIVKKFAIEGKRGDDLAQAWSSATLYYNNQGHQCSPMLLQLRWYQLKRSTRDQFYNFWFAYRGMIKRLSLAEPHTPTPLQIEIARRYKRLVTLSYLEWDEMIDRGEVILPEMLANKMIEKPLVVRKTTSVEDRTPDLEVIEPEIETIDLGVDSDNEGVEKRTTEPKSPLEPVKIKEEPADIDMEEAYTHEPKTHWFNEALQYTAEEHENFDKTENADTYDDLAEAENEITQAIQYTLNQQKQDLLPQITCVFGNVDETNSILSQIDESGATINNPSIPLEKDTEETVTTDTDIDKNLAIETTVQENPDTTDTEAIEKNLAIETTAQENLPTVINTKDSDNIPIVIEKEGEKENTIANILNCDSVEAPETIVAEIPKTTVQPEIIELDDDSDDEASKTIMPVIQNVKSESDSQVNLNVKEVKLDDEFTFGELSNDISFADDGIAFVDDGIAYHDDYEDTTKTKKEVEEKVKVKEEEPQIDRKLLMLPRPYTTRLDDMGLKYYQRIQDKQLIQIICNQSKPVFKQPILKKEIKKEIESDEEEGIEDSLKVNSSSHLLQKPRARTYNPIQLCKNPDFNTRLKRLTVGFLSSPRNRGLLKACKPLTIDLGKCFERKLVNGTLYLRANSEAVSKNTEETHQNVSVIPSAMPAQSLIDNSKPVEIFPSVNYEPLKPIEQQPSEQTNERKKVINLPDITEIRRINQTLLTAEVSPIQVQNNMPHVQVSIVSAAHKAATDVSAIKCPPSVLDFTREECNTRDASPAQTKKRYPDLVLTKMPRAGPAWTKTPTGRKKPTYAPIPPIPWLIKTPDQAIASSASKSDEALLTIDTLNKMLFLFVNDEQENNGSQKKKIKKRKPTAEKPADLKIDDNNESTSKSKLPKIVVYPAEKNSRRKKDQLGDKSSLRNSCCWAERKILKLMGIIHHLPLHDCAYPVCKCCCKNLLEEYTTNDQRQKQAEIQVLSQVGINVVDDKSTKETAETPATVAPIEILDDSPEPKLDPKKKVKVVICCPESNEFAGKKRRSLAFATVTTATATATADTVTTPATAITATVTPEIDDRTPEITVFSSAESPIKAADVAVQTNASDSETHPIIDLEAEESSFYMNGPIITDVRSVDTSGDSTSTPGLTTVNKNMLTVNSATPKRGPYVKRRGRPVKPLVSPTTANSNAQNKAGANLASSGETVTPIQPLLLDLTNQAQDNTNLLQTAPPQITPPKTLKRIMYPINKHISPQSSENPLFIDKSQILLTTVKFPPNLHKFEEAQQVLKSTVKVPHGINLVLGTDGTVTYTVSPNVEVKATDMAFVPGIVAAMQHYINTAEKKPGPEPVARINIKLGNPTVDDDDANRKSSELAVLPVAGSQTDNQNSANTNESNVTVDIISAEHSASKDVTDVSAPQTNENIIKTSKVTVEVSSSLETGQDTSGATNQNTENNQGTISEKITQTVSEKTYEAIPNAGATTENNLNDGGPSVIKQANQQGIPKTAVTTAEPQPLEANKDTNIPEDLASKSQGSSKNILSDLMTMSGIFDEDVTTAQSTEATAQPSKEITQHAHVTTINLEATGQPLEMSAQPSEVMPPPAPPLEMNSQPSEVAAQTSHVTAQPSDVTVQPSDVTAQPSTATAQPSVSMPLTSVNQEQPLPHIQNYAAPFNPHSYLQSLSFVSGKPIISELSPITSLCELKYACENNGIFFKLNFDTRVLSPIKVCMKSPNSTPKLPIPRIISGKSVIDLTEDDDAPPAKINPKRVESPIRVTSRLPIKSAKKRVKPVQIIKMVPAAPPPVTTDEGRHQIPILRKHQHLKKNVKQNVLLCDKNGIQLKKNYVSELFNTMPSSSKPKVIITKISGGTKLTPETEDNNRPREDNSDSSDEEPLAKKVKRRMAYIEAPAVTEVECGPAASTDESMDLDELHDMEPHFEIMTADENDEDSAENCILGF